MDYRAATYGRWRCNNQHNWLNNPLAMSEYVVVGAWFGWVLNYSCGLARKIRLCLIKHDVTPIGCSMFKKCFHEKASLRCVKNGSLGLRIECGYFKGNDEPLVLRCRTWLGWRARRCGCSYKLLARSING